MYYLFLGNQVVGYVEYVDEVFIDVVDFLCWFEFGCDCSYVIVYVVVQVEIGG